MSASDLVPDTSGNDIYVGFWKNHAHGGTRGTTLTLDRNGGAIFIAFLALFVATTGRGLWKILRFLLHLRLSDDGTPRELDGVYHQIQAILRNSDMAYDATKDLFWASWVWSKRAKRGPHRTFSLAILAAFTSCCLTAAGLFSSRVLDTANEALITGKNCGVLYHGPDVNAAAKFNYDSQQPVRNLQYAKQCYRQDDPSDTELCQTFPRPTLPFESLNNASCPFSKEMCKLTSGNLVLDTGYLSSVDHFGLNSIPRFLFRHQMHCAPLVTKGFTETRNVSAAPLLKFRYYRYGWYEEDYPYLLRVIVNNTRPNTILADYDIYPFWFTANVYNGYPRLLPQLQVPNASTSLLFLDASTVLYKYQTKDPWFSATTGGYGANGSRYMSDEIAAPMACVTSQEFCDPRLTGATRCTPDTQVQDNRADIARVWPNVQEQEMLIPVLYMLRAMVTEISKYAIRSGLPNLLARDTLSGDVQSASVPENQWQAEMTYLYQASLADMQSSMIEYARGYFFPGAPPCSDGNCKRVCNSQRIRSPKHYSFSVVGISVIFAIGLLIIPTATYLEELVSWVSHRTPSLRTNRRFQYAFGEWQAYSTLQLQRLAHESLGLGTWSRTDESVPVTEIGDKLGVLDVTDGRHARLIPPGQASVIITDGDYPSRRRLHSKQYAKISDVEEMSVQSLSTSHAESNKPMLGDTPAMHDDPPTYIVKYG